MSLSFQEDKKSIEPKQDPHPASPSFSIHITPPHSPAEKQVPKTEVNHISKDVIMCFM